MTDRPHVKNVNLIEEATSTKAGAAGFNMRYAWLFGLMLPVLIYFVIQLFR
jgi:hypothetical protein